MAFVINPYIRKPQIISPEKVVSELDIKSGETAIDLGSGSAHWAVALSKKVGPRGRVIVIDENEFRLSAISAKASLYGSSNIFTHQTTGYDSRIPTKEKADFAIVSNILSSVFDKESVLRALSGNLVLGAKVMIVDWAIDSLFGPNNENKVLEDDVIFVAAKTGYRFKYIVDVGTFHYGLIFEYTGDKYNGKKRK